MFFRHFTTLVCPIGFLKLQWAAAPAAAEAAAPAVAASLAAEAFPVITAGMPELVGALAPGATTWTMANAGLPAIFSELFSPQSLMSLGGNLIQQNALGGAQDNINSATEAEQLYQAEKERKQAEVLKKFGEENLNPNAEAQNLQDAALAREGSIGNALTRAREATPLTGATGRVSQDFLDRQSSNTANNAASMADFSQLWARMNAYPDNARRTAINMSQAFGNANNIMGDARTHAAGAAQGIRNIRPDSGMMLFGKMLSGAGAPAK